MYTVGETERRSVEEISDDHGIKDADRMHMRRLAIYAACALSVRRDQESDGV